MANPAINAALIAAAAKQQSAQQAILARLTKAKAFEPSSAVRIAADEVDEAALTELVGQAIVRPLGAGRYYLDRDRQKEISAQQGWIALVVIVAIGSIVASIVAIAAL